jgi:hypothetical protein
VTAYVPRPPRRPADDDTHYTGATAAFYYQGIGISCDKLSGYHPTGDLVGYGGLGDPGNYVYYAKNA